MHLNVKRMPRQKQSWGRRRFLEYSKAPRCYFGASYYMISIQTSCSWESQCLLRLKWQQLPSQTKGFSSPWQSRPICHSAQPTAPVSTVQEHDHIYFLQLRTLTNSSRQQRPVYLYFLQYIFWRIAVTIMEAIKKLALTLNKCAPMSGSSRKENLWGRCWIQGRKKSWIALARDAAQDAVAKICLKSLCSFRTGI